MPDLTNLLADIRGRVEAATEGPWTVERQTENIGGYGPYEYIHIPQVTDLEWTPDGADCHMCGADFEEADAEFIAHARADVPRLLAALEGVLALADELVSEITDEIGVEEETMDMMRDEAAKRIRAAVVAALREEA